MFRMGLLVVVFVAITAPLAVAQTPVRVRGSIEKIAGQVLTVRSRDGSTVEVQLADNYAVLVVTQASLSDIKPGVYVGAAAIKQPDGRFKALEVLVFPESARGSNEGHYPWDLTPDSMMTNATVAEIVEDVDGRVVTLRYKDGEVKMVVPPGVPIVTFGPGEKDPLKPGAHVFMSATKQADGRVTAGRVLVGKEGVVPPM